MKQWPILRDAILFVVGLGGVLHETVLTQAERPTLLILFAAMMGLPAFLRPNGIQDAANSVKEVATTVQDQISPDGGSAESKDGEAGQ